MLASGTPGRRSPLSRRNWMEKEKVTTRLDAPLKQRLKVYAAVTGLTVEDVVSSALDKYLPAVPVEVALAVASLRSNETAPAR
jgi:plasmid stability protein